MPTDRDENPSRSTIDLWPVGARDGGQDRVRDSKRRVPSSIPNEISSVERRASPFPSPSASYAVVHEGDRGGTDSPMPAAAGLPPMKLKKSRYAPPTARSLVQSRRRIFGSAHR